MTSPRAAFEWTTAIPHDDDPITASMALIMASDAAVVEGLTVIEPVRVSEQFINGPGWHTFVTLRVWRKETSND